MPTVLKIAQCIWTLPIMTVGSSVQDKIKGIVDVIKEDDDDSSSSDDDKDLSREDFDRKYGPCMRPHRYMPAPLKDTLVSKNVGIPTEEILYSFLYDLQLCIALHLRPRALETGGLHNWWTTFWAGLYASISRTKFDIGFGHRHLFRIKPRTGKNRLAGAKIFFPLRTP